MSSHISVLLKESVDYLMGDFDHEIKQTNNSTNKFKEQQKKIEIPSKDGLDVFIDATFGAGGHTRYILEKNPNAKVIAIDRDPSVKVFAEQIEKEFPGRLLLINDKFSNISSALLKNNIDLTKIGGVIYDLGFSSMQIDSESRGFSFKYSANLDMSMGCDGLSAIDFLNENKEEEISQILFNYSDERNSRKIAKKIVEYRQKKPITTTEQLVEIVCSVNGAPRYGKIHPATRTFQAIRMYVNSEIEELVVSLLSAIAILPTGANISIISFHSVEDLIVKIIFKLCGGQPIFIESIPSFINKAISDGIDEVSKKHHNMKDYQTQWRRIIAEQEFLAIKPKVITINKKPITPSKQELQTNPRAGSSKLRALKLNLFYFGFYLIMHLL